MGEGLKRAKRARAAKATRKATRKQPQVQTATDKTFAARTRKGLVLVDFWAPWCAPCLSMRPIIERLAAVTPDLKIVAVNISGADGLIKSFGISSIPRLIILRDSNVVDDITGTQSLAELQSAVAEARDG